LIVALKLKQIYYVCLAQIHLMRLFLVLLLVGCASGVSAQITDTAQKVISGRVNDPQQEKKPYVIFISADGFRYDLADIYHATHLQALRARGIAAVSMTPSFPSVTFPNHYSLATGLYPAHHGLVDNTMYDPKKGKGYRINDRGAVTDSSWYGGTPIWVLAEQQKMLSASFFWVGSEAAVDGVRPTYYYLYNDQIPLDHRLQVVKEWLELPEDRRPHVILFYLSQVDHAEHLFGPESQQTGAAVHLVDDCVGKMAQIVDSLRLPVNFVFVSDHGMEDVDTLHGIYPPAVLDTARFKITFGETMIHLYAKDKGDIQAEYEALKKEAGAETTSGYEVFLATETPDRWHYSTKDDRYGRIGDIILVARAPRVFAVRGRRINPGAHGFDNALPGMGATFYAWGPAFRQQIIPAFANVNVYPLIARILGLTISDPIDGSLGELNGTLKE
jgi:predicted AlkP superfamily pyrophosphatase or phosphodiesterase